MQMPKGYHFAISILISFLALPACAPRVVQIAPKEGAPGTQVSLTMEYLVGWPRVEIGSQMMDYYKLKLSSAHPTDNPIEDEELSWIEDKILQFQVPDLPPGNYLVTIYDDKGPPGDKIYAVLETTAYLIAPPVWPFVFRSNQTTVNFKVTRRTINPDP
ncbi:MAG: hypothetical protein IH856_21215 [Deltaproteobacteria bacterium]|nr:hypothetical protein [Deltaproteobacteria bacterium]